MSKRKLGHADMANQPSPITSLDRFLHKASSDLDGRIDSMEKKIREEKLKLAAVSSSLKSMDMIVNQPLDSDIISISDETLITTSQTDSAVIQHPPLSPQECSAEISPGPVTNETVAPIEHAMYIPPRDLEPVTKRKKPGANSSPAPSTANISGKNTTKGKGRGRPKIRSDPHGKTPKMPKNSSVNKAPLIKSIEQGTASQVPSFLALLKEHLSNTIAPILDRLLTIEGKLDRMSSVIKNLEHGSRGTQSYDLSTNISSPRTVLPALPGLLVPIKNKKHKDDLIGKPITTEEKLGIVLKDTHTLPTCLNQAISVVPNSIQVCPVNAAQARDPDHPLAQPGPEWRIGENRLQLQTRHLDLPPAANPFVIVLVNVPALTASERETSKSLINRVSQWMSRRLGSECRLGEGIIMAERVSWLGHRSKPPQATNDCVVINFNSSHLAGRALAGLNRFPEEPEGIQVCPLGFFYPPNHFSGIDTWASATLGPSTSDKSIHTLPKSSVHHLPFIPHPLMHLKNRFAPLMDLNSLD